MFERAVRVNVGNCSIVANLIAFLCPPTLIATKRKRTIIMVCNDHDKKKSQILSLRRFMSRFFFLHFARKSSHVILVHASNYVGIEV